MSVDEILEDLVRRAEEKGIGHTITLCIGGNVVSGFMIRSKTYYEIMSTYFEKSKFVVKDKHFEKKWIDYKNDYKDFMMNLKTKEENDSREIKYIHLKNASIVIANIPHTFSLWRGKLSSVDGFSLSDITHSLETF